MKPESRTDMAGLRTLTILTPTVPDTPPFTSVRFVLAVRDLARSIEYYVAVLGLTIDFEAPGWYFLSRGCFRLMLGECTDATPTGEIGNHSYCGYVTVTDSAALLEEYQQSGVAFTQPLADKHWGMREFGILTDDGHRLMFGQQR